MSTDDMEYLLKTIVTQKVVLINKKYLRRLKNMKLSHLYETNEEADQTNRTIPEEVLRYEH